MRWGIVSCVAMATVVALVACGASQHDQRPQPQARQTSSCLPRSLSNRFEQLLADVSARRRQAALGVLAQPKSMLRVTIYHGRRAGAGRVDSETPRAVFQSLANTIPAGRSTRILAAAVGDNAPFAAAYRRSAGSGKTAGMEFIAAIGSKVLSGKVGFACADGRLYVGAMQATSELGPGRRLCGQEINPDMRSRVVCRI